MYKESFSSRKNSISGNESFSWYLISHLVLKTGIQQHDQVA
jgi:hypothetical protein